MRSETTIAKEQLKESYAAMLQWRTKAEQLEAELKQLRNQLAEMQQRNHAQS